MQSRGNIYQGLIFAAQDYLDEQGYLPADLDDFARFAKAGAEEVRAVFASPEDLREGLVYHGVTLLNDAIRQGVIEANTGDPIAQMHAIAESYLNWAQSNAALFRLIVAGLNGPIKPGSALHRYTSSMRDLYHRKFSEAQQLGILAPDCDIEILTMMLHCLTKGGNMMFLTRNTDPWFDGDQRSTLELSLRIFSEFMDNLVRANHRAAVQPDAAPAAIKATGKRPSGRKVKSGARAG